MIPEVMNIGEAVDLLANTPMTEYEALCQVNGYRWFIAVIQARFFLETIDMTGNIDSGLI